MVIGASTEEPVIFALAIFDRQVVDAGDPPSHQTLFVELPILVAIATKPVASLVVPFVRKAYGYPVVAKRPDLLDQPILQLVNPLAYEECLDGLAATNKLGAIAPDAIHRIGKRYFGRIARVPGILGEARLLRGAFGCEGRQRWAGHCRSLLVSEGIGGPLTHTGCLNAVASTGIFRSRLPVAAKIALATAGTMPEVPHSPMPPGGSEL